MIKRIIGHLKTITKHKWVVFKLSCMAGIPWRGLVHDLSKYSPTEFVEGVRYYKGTNSPIGVCKKTEGYSKAWLHHKGRNKHHPEYWYDYRAKNATPLMPYKYTVEMICDTLAAGIVYNGKKWTTNTQLEYWTKVERDYNKMDQRLKDLLTYVYTKVSQNGITETITKENMKKWYDEICIRGEKK